MAAQLDDAIRYTLFALGTWQVTNLVEWLLHTLSHLPGCRHAPILRDIHRIHMEHHKTHYPVSRLLREPPYKDGGGTLAFGPIVLAVLVSAFLALPRDLFTIFACESLTLLGASTYLHDQYATRIACAHHPQRY
jgi:hypothetical protein